MEHQLTVPKVLDSGSGRLDARRVAKFLELDV